MLIGHSALQTPLPMGKGQEHRLLFSLSPTISTKVLVAFLTWWMDSEDESRSSQVFFSVDNVPETVKFVFAEWQVFHLEIRLKVRGHIKTHSWKWNLKKTMHSATPASSKGTDDREYDTQSNTWQFKGHTLTEPLFCGGQVTPTASRGIQTLFPKLRSNEC